MATTITLKNIPDALYERLREAARAHHRSLNSEVIASLEIVLAPRQVSAQERLERARQLRANPGVQRLSAEDIENAIQEGRP